MTPNKLEDNQGVVTDAHFVPGTAIAAAITRPDYRTNWTQQGNCYRHRVVSVSDSECNRVGWLQSLKWQDKSQGVCSCLSVYKIV